MEIKNAEVEKAGTVESSESFESLCEELSVVEVEDRLALAKADRCNIR
jgi:hypothetical protein